MTALPDIGVCYEVRHSNRARRLQAAVRDGRIEVVVPRWARPAQVRAFVLEAAPWMARRAATLSRHAGAILPDECVSGARVLLEGVEVALRVESSAVRRPQVTRGEELILRLPTAPEPIEPRARAVLLSWLKERARDVTWAHIETYAARLGKRPRGVRIKAQKTVWGSCGRTGLININWRLIGAPPKVFEYIVVHEVCHLEQRNHGPRFWRLVERLMPGYEVHKAWLREHGLRLG